MQSYCKGNMPTPSLSNKTWQIEEKKDLKTVYLVYILLTKLYFQSTTISISITPLYMTITRTINIKSTHPTTKNRFICNLNSIA